MNYLRQGLLIIFCYTVGLVGAQPQVAPKPSGKEAACIAIFHNEHTCIPVIRDTQADQGYLRPMQPPFVCPSGHEKIPVGTYKVTFHNNKLEAMANHVMNGSQAKGESLSIADIQARLDSKAQHIPTNATVYYNTKIGRAMEFRNDWKAYLLTTPYRGGSNPKQSDFDKDVREYLDLSNIDKMKIYNQYRWHHNPFYKAGVGLAVLAVLTTAAVVTYKKWWAKLKPA